MVIAIDGPVASGKGTVAKLLAKRLNFLCLDTGAVYRGITVFFLSNGKPKPADFERLLPGADIEIKCDAEKNTLVFLNGKDITQDIRTVEVGSAVPEIARYEFVQHRVREIQYKTARDNDLVVEGRETTSVAFPNAEYKFYLTADLDERSRRRHAEFIKKGEKLSFEKVREMTAERDRLDITREISPLIKVADAVEIDATKRTVHEVVDEMAAVILK
jgi:cytidylate kinase